MVEIQHSTSTETYMWRKQLAAMLAIYGKGVTSEVNLRKCISHMPPPSVTKAAHSGFDNQRRHHQKSETEVSVASKMDMCPSRKRPQLHTNRHAVKHM